MELWDDGTGRITIQKGKNQVEPATVAVTVAATRVLGQILPDDADPAAPVFGLSGEALANRVRAAARAAGLGDGFSGHRGRIGMARRMVAAEASNAAVQRQGRWKHGDMVARWWPKFPSRSGVANSIQFGSFRHTKHRLVSDSDSTEFFNK